LHHTKKAGACLI